MTKKSGIRTHEPTAKELMTGTVLDGYIERSLVKPLTKYPPEVLTSKDGKVIARVLGWESGKEKTSEGKPRVVIPKGRHITNLEAIPKNALSIGIIVFDKHTRLPLSKVDWHPREAVAGMELTE